MARDGWSHFVIICFERLCRTSDYHFYEPRRRKCLGGRMMARLCMRRPILRADKQQLQTAESAVNQSCVRADNRLQSLDRLHL